MMEPSSDRAKRKPTFSLPDEFMQMTLDFSCINEKKGKKIKDTGNPTISKIHRKFRKTNLLISNLSL